MKLYNYIFIYLHCYLCFCGCEGWEVFKDSVYVFFYGEESNKKNVQLVENNSSEKTFLTKKRMPITDDMYDTVKTKIKNIKDSDCFEYGIYYKCNNGNDANCYRLNCDNIDNMSNMFIRNSNVQEIMIVNKCPNVRNLCGFCMDCHNLQYVDIRILDTNNVTNMSYMFSWCNSLKELDLSNWDTHNVTDMSCMFEGCSSLTSLNISKFNTTKVTNMQYMFSGCSSLTILYLSSFNTSNVTNMKAMFYGCSNLENLYLGKYFSVTEKTINVNMFHFFDEALSDEYIKKQGNSVICNVFGSMNVLRQFTVNDIINSIKYKRDDIFKITINKNTNDDRYYTTLNMHNTSIESQTKHIYIIKNFSKDNKGISGHNPKSIQITIGDDKSNVNNNFNFCFNKEDVNNHYILYNNNNNISNVTNNNINNIENENENENVNDNEINTNKENFIYNNNNYKRNDNINNVNIVNTEFINNDNTICIKKITVEELKPLQSLLLNYNIKLKNDNNSSKLLAIITVNEDRYLVYCENANSISKDNVTYGLFQGSEVTKIEIISCGSGIKNMSYMFAGCQNLIDLDLYNLKTSNTTNMQAMFKNCTSLTELDLDNFDTINVTDMNYMFAYCTSLTNIKLSNFKTDKVTNMSYMFSECENLTQLNLGNFNFLQVINMTNMFQKCYSLSNLYLSNFNTSKVKDMSYMFADCSSLTNINLSKFNTDTVENIIGIFKNCSSLTELDLSNFNTKKVKDMSYMFYGCSNLTKIIFPNNFNTTNVTNMSYMFAYCSSLKELNLSSFNTENVTNMRAIFFNCSSLKELDLSNFKTDKVTDMKGMFNTDISLTISFSLFCSAYMRNKIFNDYKNLCQQVYDLIMILTRNKDIKPKAFETKLHVVLKTDYTRNTDNDINNNQNCSYVLVEDVFIINDKYSYCTIEDTNKGININSNENNEDKGKILQIKCLSEDIYNTIMTRHRYIFDITTKQKSIQEYNTMWFVCEDPNIDNKNGINISDYIYNIETKIKNEDAYIIALVTIEEGNGKSLFKAKRLFYCPNVNIRDREWYGLFENMIFIKKIEILACGNNIVNMSRMFKNCTNLIEVDLRRLKTDNVTDMSYMFSGCSNLTQLDLTSFNTNKVTDMSYMFDLCNNLRSLDLTSFKVNDNVDVTDMFFQKDKLKNIKYDTLITDDTAIKQVMIQIADGAFEAAEKIAKKLTPANFLMKTIKNTINYFAGLCPGMSSYGKNEDQFENIKSNSQRYKEYLENNLSDDMFIIFNRLLCNVKDVDKNDILDNCKYFDALKYVLNPRYEAYNILSDKKCVYTEKNTMGELEHKKDNILVLAINDSFYNILLKKEIISGSNKIKYSQLYDDCLQICFIRKDYRLLSLYELSNIFLKNKNRIYMSIYNIKKELDKYVYGQDKAKNDLALILNKHYSDMSSNTKNINSLVNSILLIGPCGTGKTLLSTAAAKILNIPHMTISVGSMLNEETTLQDIFNDHYNKACYGDEYYFERSIVFVDEFDKIFDNYDKKDNARVQDEIKKFFLEALNVREKGAISINNDIKLSNLFSSILPSPCVKNVCHFNTSKMLFIFSGAFNGIKKIIQNRTHSTENNLFKYLSSEDLIQYGMYEDMVSRLSNRTYTEYINKEMVRGIVLMEKGAFKMRQHDIEKNYNIKFIFNDKIIDNFVEELISCINDIDISGARPIVSKIDNFMDKMLHEVSKTQKPVNIKEIQITQRHIDTYLR